MNQLENPATQRWIWVWHPRRGVVRFRYDCFLRMRSLHRIEVSAGKRRPEDVLRRTHNPDRNENPHGRRASERVRA